MTTHKKQKRALRQKAEKAGMSYAAAVNAEAPKSEFDEYLFAFEAPLSPARLADAFAVPEGRKLVVRRILVNAKTYSWFRKFSRDYIDLESSLERHEQGFRGSIWAAELKLDETVPDDTVKLLSSPPEKVAPRPVLATAPERPIIDVDDDDLVVIFKAGKPIAHFPGHKTMGECRIYQGPKQIGLLQRFRLDTCASSSLVDMEFVFPEDRSMGESTLAETNARIEKLQRAFPLAKIRKDSSDVNRTPRVVREPVASTEGEAPKSYASAVAKAQTEALLKREAFRKWFTTEPGVPGPIGYDTERKLSEVLAEPSRDPDYMVVTNLPIDPDDPAIEGPWTPAPGVPYTAPEGKYGHWLYEKAEDLIHALVSKKAEIGAGVVLNADDPRGREFGWIIWPEGTSDSYAFTIRVSDPRVLPAPTDKTRRFWKAFKTAAGRAKIGAAFTRGATLETMDEILKELGIE